MISEVQILLVNAQKDSMTQVKKFVKNVTLNVLFVTETMFVPNVSTHPKETHHLVIVKTVGRMLKMDL
jgi:hypothetical protein